MPITAIRRISMPHVAAVAVIAALAMVLVPASASAHTPAVVDGRLAGAAGPGDGVKIFLRYLDNDHYYAVHVNRRDGGMRIQRKSGSGDYASLEATQPPGFAPYGTAQQVEVSAVDQANGSVAIQLRVDGRIVNEAVDAGQTSHGPPIRQDGAVGIRGDNVEFLLDRFRVHRAGTDGSATGGPLVADDFDRQDGLITNQRIQSVQDDVWNVTSGSLYASDGRGWSGVPTDIRPDPESRWSSNSSTFRMVTNRDDLRDVTVTFELINRGYVDPTRRGELAEPMPEPYPSASNRVEVTRLDGRDHAQVAIAASERAFGGAPAAVLISSSLEAHAIAAPALAGHLGGPVLLSSPSSLHPDTLAELARLGVSRVHLVGSFGAAVDSALEVQGYAVTRYAGGNAAEVGAAVAREVGGSRLLLSSEAGWRDAVTAAGAAAARQQPIVLTGTSSLGSAARATIDDLDPAEIVVMGNDLAPSIVRGLRAEGRTVSVEGHSRYSVARVGADLQHEVVGAAAEVWLAGGARPFHALTGGPASAEAGGVLLVVQPDDLGDVSLADLRYEGYEARHWVRRHRHELDRLLPLGPTSGLADRVVDQVRAGVTTIVAGLSDIAGTTHEEAIVGLVERGIAGGYADGTYRPNQAVSRGQMASFLAGARELPPTPTTFPDAVGTTHELWIGAVAEAGIAGGFGDGTYRPNDPVTRGQMATFVGTAWDLPPAVSQLSDVAGTTHADAIGSIEAAGITGGFADGTYRPNDPVTRGQMATFLMAALQLP